MIDTKYTPDGLPVVTVETVLSTMELREELVGLEEKIKKENPVLYAFMQEMMDKNEKTISGLTVGFVAGFLSVYEILSRQAASNKLEERLKQPE